VSGRGGRKMAKRWERTVKSVEGKQNTYNGLNKTEFGWI
jgi:hypothetical protein